MYNLSCEVSANEPLLVTGPNTSGKSSLFRVVGGKKHYPCLFSLNSDTELWPVRAGQIGKPQAHGFHQAYKDVFLVPQKPYHVRGKLFDQVTYPIRLPHLDQASEDRCRKLVQECLIL